MRLQKFLAMCTDSSRRNCEAAIISGEVAINGVIAKIGTCINPETDVVSWNGQTVSYNKVFENRRDPLAIVLNKPRGYVCSHFDRYNKRTIFDLIPKEFAKGKLLFCGRLDKDTEGMLIITNDGNFAQMVTHPSNGIRKRYEVIVSRRPTEEILRKTIHGINDGGDFLKFEKITQIGRGNMKNLVFEVELAQGKKNEIHRVFEHFGIFVKSLKRTRIGNLTLRGISLGRCKKLTTKDIDLLLGKF